MNSKKKQRKYNCILGVDYGTKYIGLALGRGDLVMPFDTLNYKKGHKIGDDAIEKIVKYVADEKCDLVVIGLPLLHSKETKMSKEVREFGDVLQSKLNENDLVEVKIEFVDESRTSKEGVKKAVEMNISKKRRKSDHSLAACGIIEMFWLID